jgi:hypothetical protein
MSYSRFIESDAYIFMHAGTNRLVCMACGLGEMDSVSFNANSTQEMVDHLKVHESRGDRLPENIYDELWKDDPENYPQNTQPSPVRIPPTR